MIYPSPPRPLFFRKGGAKTERFPALLPSPFCPKDSFGGEEMGVRFLF